MRTLVYETPQDLALLQEEYPQNAVVFDNVVNEYYTKESGSWYRIQEYEQDIFQKILDYGIDLNKLKEMLDDWEKEKYPERFI
jgi:hypothetical protein